MDEDAGAGELGELGVGRHFVRQVVVIPRDAIQSCDEIDWRDCLVVVRRGTIELIGRSGREYCFEEGAVLYLADVPVQSIRNLSDRSAVLVAVSRSAALRIQDGRPRS